MNSALVSCVQNLCVWEAQYTILNWDCLWNMISPQSYTFITYIVSIIWQDGFSSFQGRDTKLVRFLKRNPHSTLLLKGLLYVRHYNLQSFYLQIHFLKSISLFSRRFLENFVIMYKMFCVWLFWNLQFRKKNFKKVAQILMARH